MMLNSSECYVAKLASHNMGAFCCYMPIFIKLSLKALHVFRLCNTSCCDKLGSHIACL